MGWKESETARSEPSRRKRRANNLVPSELVEMDESNEIRRSADVYLQKFVNNQESGGRSRARQVDAKRITSLPDEPLENAVPASEDEAARRTNSISPVITSSGGRGELRQTILPTLNHLDQSRGQTLEQQQASHFNTSDCLLVLLIGYILWQCILKNRKKRAKCLRRLRSLRDKLLARFEGNADEPNGAELSSRVVDCGQLKLDATNKADEAIETLEQERPGDSKRPPLVQLKQRVAKNSFVVAVGEAARPRVKILNERVRTLVEGTDARTDRWPFSRNLKTRLAGLFARPAGESADIELGQAGAFCSPRVHQPSLEPDSNSACDIIEAIVHRNDDVRSDSLVGFAGSFLEHQTSCSPSALNNQLLPSQPLGVATEPERLAQTLNPSSNHLSELPASASSNSHLSASLLSGSSTSNNLLGGPIKLSPIHRANAIVSQNLLSACNTFELQCPLQGEAAARSSSQTCSPNYLDARQTVDYHAKSASPNICRPCGSTSPRHQPLGVGAKANPRAGARAQATNVNCHSLLGSSGQAGSCNLPSSSPQSLAHSAFNGRQCRSSNNGDRLKHHYENYYDDECEDAYRRLTASIGMQFGLDFDPATCAGHQQPAYNAAHPFLYGQNPFVARQTARAAFQQFQKAPACRCCSSSARLGGDVPSSSAEASLGGSDSGNFSTKLDANNSACQNPACAMCLSSPLGQTPLAPGMSILVQQPSVSNSPPPSQQPAQKSVDFQVEAGASELVDVSPATFNNHSLGPRWNQRRRSTMSACSRSPRRMSLAGVANWPAASQASGLLAGATCQHGLNHSHLLHRASIASDGQRQHHQPLERYQPYSMHPAGQLSCAGHHRLGGGSQYSSSAGSSSGIGFSGSQCTNTPTTSIFPYGSSMGIGTKPLEPAGLPTSSEQLVKGPLMGPSFGSQPQYQCCASNYNNLIQFEPASSGANSELVPLYDPNSLSQLHLSHQLQMNGLRQPSGAQLMPIMCQGSIKPFEGSSATSRKYSLPVQLESNAAEMAEQKRSPNLLFKIPADGDDENVSPQSHMEPLSTGGPGGDAAEIPRRSSQTIARQSSFWLEDNSVDLPLPVGGEEEPIASSRSEMPPTRARSGSPSSRPASSASPSKSPGAPAKKHARPPSSTSSSSPTSSPSPDFFASRSRACSRPLGLGPSSGSISKRQSLAKLRSRRAKRQLSKPSDGQKASREQENSAKSHSLEINSTDEEHSKGSKDSKLAAAQAGRSSEREDSFGSSLDRDFLAAPPPAERKIRDSNSASLERQCRDLWKLRSTLHNDASFGDNWSNYHQRLNRRYDSGYKSIENQFNSSLEGNVPVPTAPTAEDIISDAFTSPDQTKLEEPSGREKAAPKPLDPELLVRPQSGCSGFVRDNQQPNSVIGRRSTTPVIDDEETQALLADCDQHQDEPSPVADANPAES